MTDLDRLMRRMIAAPIAHRGLHASGGPPENSMAAAEAAIEAGYAIECDVQLSGDGVPVVFHDETLDRVSNTVGALRDHTAEALGSLRLNDTDESVPTLAEFLALVGDRAPLLIELKRQDKRILGRPPNHGRNKVLAEAVAEVLSAYRGEAALMSFDPRLTVFARRFSPERPRGIVAMGAASDNEGHVPDWQHFGGSHLLHLPWSRPHFIAYEAAALPAFVPVKAAKAMDIPLLSWTVRSQAEADRLAPLLDQIIFEDFRPRSDP